MSELTSRKRRRGSVRRSITHLVTKFKDLESKTDRTSLELVKGMAPKLKSLDEDFHKLHYEVVELIEESDATALAKEQETLDAHDDEVGLLAVRIQQYVTANDTDSDSRTTNTRKLARLVQTVTTIQTAIDATPAPIDTCLLHLHEEQLRDVKSEVGRIYNDLVAMKLSDSDTLFTTQASLEKGVFECSLKIKKLLSMNASTATGTAPPSVDLKGVKLPKLDVPTFDGQVVNWRSFWEQFEVSVNSQTALSDSEKLVYLKHALKDGSAKKVIEGLSRTGDHYQEAVKLLKSRYDRPRLIHQTHVQKILEAPCLRDGTGKELRRLYDIVQQHLRALTAMDCEPSGPFITSVIELKLDQNTMFEWQKASQSSTDVPHYRELLDFINLRAQASEATISDKRHAPISGNRMRVPNPGKNVAAFAANAVPENDPCTLCVNEHHPLYLCPKFKAYTVDQRIATLKSQNRCINCLRTGHFAKQCKSLHHCRKCQKLHHTLLHVDRKDPVPPNPPSQIANNTASTQSPGAPSQSLLMTCRISVHGPNGCSVEARALLDSASSASFISERMAQSLNLPRSTKHAKIFGVAGLSQSSPNQSLTSFSVSPLQDPETRLEVKAVVVPRVTCHLPLQPVVTLPEWDHLNDLTLADPEFGLPNRIDVLLGVDPFVQVLRQGRRYGPPGAPSAFETEFGWVLAGETNLLSSHVSVTSCHGTLTTNDIILQRFWETEEQPTRICCLTPEEKMAEEHFKTHYRRIEDGRFVVPLPRKPQYKPIGESRSQAVRRFLSMERSLQRRGLFHELRTVMNEYFDKQHAELVPTVDLDKPAHQVFYLPMQVVCKSSSSTTKVRAVFDASASSSTGTSLNDTLLVGPTVHSPLYDVLLCFRSHRIALTTDVSRMYRAVLLDDPDKDLHRFVWRSEVSQPLRDYRMSRITFGVSASSHIANMCLKQNAADFANTYPLAAKVVNQSFYVDDGLTDADTAEEAIELQKQLQDLFARGGFTLRKWNSSNPLVLQHLSDELKEPQSLHSLPGSTEYTKTLGIEWNTVSDQFRLTISPLPPLDNITKRFLISDVSKTFDVFGWFAPSTILMKILFQRLWELKVDCDEEVPTSIREPWIRWRSEFNVLSVQLIPRCYFPKECKIVSTQLHGFCDASERAYAAVAYLRMLDSDGIVHVTLVTSKTKVAPIKRLTIPRLELCGARLVAELLHHVQVVLQIPSDQLFAWTDSTIVLSWLAGNPRQYKTYVANRVSQINELLPYDCWRHVDGVENPADCASRGLFPTELLDYHLWWNGPEWLKLDPSSWPQKSLDAIIPVSVPEEERMVSLHIVTTPKVPVIPLQRYSGFNRLVRVTAWISRFVYNCRAKLKQRHMSLSTCLTVPELTRAEAYWYSIIQEKHFLEETTALRNNRQVSKSSPLLSLHPFLDSNSLIRVGGRISKANRAFSSCHPIIIHGKHPITKLIIRTEHTRLLHAGPALLSCSLNRRLHIVGGRQVIRSITRACVICRRVSAKPREQLMGQLPPERISPDSVFNRVGIDYAGPFQIKQGHTRRPTIIKAYACLFVSLTVKAVHIEVVSDLTSEAFIACLRRFVSRRGKPHLIWSDHGTNFVGASRELKEFLEFLREEQTQKVISEFCNSQHIEWRFIPEHSPHFGGLWEAAVRSMKKHTRRIISGIKLTFEELTTTLAQVESCLNSRPLVAMPPDDDGIEALTPGHFLIGRPLEALPDPPNSYQSLSLLRRWNLCQALLRDFWKRWSDEYIASMQKTYKWHRKSRNISVDDIVLVRESGMIPTTWPLARVIEVYPGEDGIVRVVKLKTSSGIYTRPTAKIAVILPRET